LANSSFFFIYLFN